MVINKRLKDLRSDSGLTLEEVASKVGLTKATLHKYESGRITNIPSDKIEILAEVYGCSPGYIMGWTDVKNENKPDDPVEEEIRSIAAHATRKLTKEEIEEIRKFAEYIIQRDNK